MSARRRPARRESAPADVAVAETAPGGDDDARARDYVRSLERGLTVIGTFTADAPALTVSEVAERTEMTRAATRRFLLTLIDLGYVVTDGRYYELTPRVLELGYSYLSALSFPDAARPHLERLVDEAGEPSEGSILDGPEIVYVVRAPGPSVMTTSVPVGGRMPAFATSMGRVLLAGLDDAALAGALPDPLPALRPGTLTDAAALRAELARVREQGWALVDQELEEGLVALAVPVHDADARVVAAINLSTHVGRRPAGALLELLPALQRTAARVERDLLPSTAA